MTLRLRSHHLLCLLTYVGRGYSPAFTANYDVIAGRIMAGDHVIIVSGPDDICAPMLGEADPHCLHRSVLERDRQAALDVGAVLGISIRPGVEVRLDGVQLALLRRAFAAGRTRSACRGCEWAGLCSDVAGNGYEGARVQFERSLQPQK